MTPEFDAAHRLGAVLSWGLGAYGELGHGDTQRQLQPIKLPAQEGPAFMRESPSILSARLSASPLPPCLADTSYTLSSRVARQN
mmetsp:Transcript_49182/g.160872  ORF Transcript_49182/g.160872 Transcript_49182/m.160872 type:complete len:84 (+) Transcript_49182:429-680(+)